MPVISGNIGRPDSRCVFLLSGRNPLNLKDIATGKTITNDNNVGFQSTITHFNPNALSFNGSNQYLAIADSDDFAFGSGDFTIDFWINFITLPDDGGAVVLFDHRNIGNNNAHDLEVDTVGTTSNLYYYLAIPTGTKVLLSGTTALSTGIWYHIAVIKTGNDFKMYLNGTKEGNTVTYSTAMVNFSSPFYICCYCLISNSLSNYTNCYFDELRISNYARWTANFTPPTRNYHHQST